MQVRFRPISSWPAEFVPGHRHDPFRASFGQTLQLLEFELDKLGASDVVIEAGFREQDIRLDGWPRSNAQQPSFPGVIVNFESHHGPLRYGTSMYVRWQANLRAIALGLEALRAVDRHGIGQRGEQYAGWKQLTAGGPDVARGRTLIAHHGGERAARFATHPDQGGDAKDFADVQAAIEASRG